MKQQAITASGRQRSAQQTARRIGWLSIGVGLAELLLPRAAARAAGMQGMAGGELLLRGFGLREIATGVGILASRNPAPWMWARVGGDVLDLAAVGARMQGDNPHRQKAAMAFAAIAGATAVDVACARALEAEGRRRRALTGDYRQRSDLSRPPVEVRGAAREDLVPPTDTQTPRGMRPYVVADNSPPR